MSKKSKDDLDERITDLMDSIDDLTIVVSVYGLLIVLLIIVVGAL